MLVVALVQSSIYVCVHIRVRVFSPQVTIEDNLFRFSIFSVVCVCVCVYVFSELAQYLQAPAGI